MNFAKGILESRKQTYRHLAKLLKAIPLETPTKIGLAPGNEIWVTLFDANHCVGACMFLIQDASGTAILYTGDIRSETWFVNSLVQNPLLIAFTSGLQRLDCIYLDSTFATKSDIHRTFPSKAGGLQELLEKVSQYPKETIFYFQSWTFGYENAWIALSSTINSQVHLDNYRWRMYKSLTAVSGTGLPEPREAAQLCGFMCGNHRMPGCLTTDTRARIHSCERGAECHVIKESPNVVQIIPIITRTRGGIDVVEPGAGGGLGDLSQVHELDLIDPSTVTQLISLCALNIKDQVALTKVLQFLTTRLSGGTGRLRLDAADIENLEDNDEGLTLDHVVDVLRSAIREPREEQRTAKSPKVITFPYSRHSSYSELCEFVAAFRPKDICPCTVDEAHWSEDVSMRALFGEHCSGDVFVHDKAMREKLGLLSNSQGSTKASQKTQIADVALDAQKQTSLDSQETESEVEGHDAGSDLEHNTFHSACAKTDDGVVEAAFEGTMFIDNNGEAVAGLAHGSFSSTRAPKRRKPSTDDTSEAAKRLSIDRGISRWAYDAAAGLNGMSWESFGGLDCTRQDAEDSQEL